MALRLGMTGMDAATEAELKAAFAQADAAGQWTLATPQDADYVIVDMDTMYGPMSWVQLHGAGKSVIGLSDAGQTQADHLLARPIEAAGLATLLRAIADSAGVPVTAVPPAPAAPAEPAPLPQPPPEMPAPPPAAPSGMTAAPAPQDQLPEEVPNTASAAPVATPRPKPVMAAEPEPTPVAHAEPAPEAEPVPPPVPSPPPREKTLADWLAPGALSGRVRYARGDGQMLWVDAGARQYHGPAVLKPMAPYFDGRAVEAGDFEAVDDATWQQEATAAGAAQPLARLHWYGHLLAGRGRLRPGLDPDAPYRLLKWPQTEREFPKHFRIATQMMKGPASVAEIAQASQVSAEEVADFVNANLATGFAEAYVPPPPEEPARPAGLFGRLRGR